MRIVFMGTPDFAVPSLASLLAAGHTVPLVVTREDARAGRGKKIQVTPVKALALENNIPVLQPTTLRGNEEAFAAIAAAEPDAIVVAAYGRILPPEIIHLPRYGCINVHGSLLPRFRGAAPIQRSILAGDRETGVTIMHMDEGLDTGAMMAKVTCPVGSKTGGELFDELALAGAQLLVDTLARLEKGEEVVEEAQEEALATYAPMITKKDGEIQFTNSAQEIQWQIQGLSPWPGTYTYLDGQVFKIWMGEALTEEVPGEKTPGTVLQADKEGLCIACGQGILKVTEIQAPGKRRMTVADFLKGHKIETNTVLG